MVINNKYWNINNDWMSLVDGEKDIRDLAIPGSHDSCTGKKWYKLGLAGLVFFTIKTCTTTIPQQLDLGVRFLDIRMSLNKNGVLKARHGIASLKKSNKEVLYDIQEFLKKNPNETILLSYQREDYGLAKKSYTDDMWMSVFMQDILESQLEYGNIILKDIDTYKLKNLRGKIVILQINNIKTESFRNIDIISNDDYWVQRNSMSISKKLSNIFRNFFIDERKEKQFKKYSIHGNGVGTLIPIPWPKYISRRINKPFINLTENFLKSGIYVMDYEELCTGEYGGFYEKIIKSNF